MTIVFGGRLDQRLPLCDELSLPASVDACTIVRNAYRRWGREDFAAHLVGDFATILWDAALRRLILTRSPSGLYGLCYALQGDELAFASTPHLLLRTMQQTASLDEAAVAEWLVLRPRLSDRSLFSQVRRVLPGTSVVFEKERLSTVRYWRPENLSPLLLNDHREYADALRESLQLAVADRLRESTGSISSQLSGGLDSSSVTTVAAEQLAQSGTTLFALTAVPGEIGRCPVQGRFLDESQHAAAVASLHRNVIHHLVRPRGSSLFDVLDRYTDVECGPPFNPHHLLWLDATYAAAPALDCSTMLTGSMGNATISGSGDLAVMQALHGGKLLGALRMLHESNRAGSISLRNMPALILEPLAPGLLEVWDRIRKARSRIEDFTGIRPEFAEAVGLDLNRWNRRNPFSTAEESSQAFVDRFDLGMLHESPRMLYGLDVTDPTYDRRVVELTLRIPLEQFCYGGVPRALLRTAMQGRLPNMVRLERRRGLQSADFLSMFQRERTAIEAELAKMARLEFLTRAIDVPLLQERLHWSDERIIDYGWYEYSNRLMRGISLGRFVRRMVEGDLFRTSTEPIPAGPGFFSLQA